MKINTKIKFLQEGGTMTPTSEGSGNSQMPAQEAAPAANENPVLILADMAAQALQNNDCQMGLQVCQGYLQLVQQMAGEGGEGEPVSQGEPVYRKGGKLAYRQK